VQTAASDGQRLDVKLKAPVPVHFVYLTAFAKPNGVVEFRPDIYGRDSVGDGADDPRDAVVAQQRAAVTP
jgi:murein L,D-transpeptidase YcbB/YkuD